MKTASFIPNSKWEVTNKAYSATKIHDGHRVEIISGPWPSHYFTDKDSGGLFLVRCKCGSVPGTKQSIISVYGRDLQGFSGHMPEPGWGRKNREDSDDSDPT